MGGIGKSTLSSSEPHLLFLFRLTGGVSASCIWGTKAAFSGGGIPGNGGTAGC